MKCCSARRSLLLLLATFVLLSFIPFQTNLAVKNRQGQYIELIPVGNSDYFSVTFRHSVNKGEIIERYQIDKKNRIFYLQTGWFESYGAGMMDSLADGVSMREEGKYLRLDFPAKNLTQVSYAAAGIADHVLQIGDKKIHLFEENPYKTNIISLEKRSLWQICFH